MLYLRHQNLDQVVQQVHLVVGRLGVDQLGQRVELEPVGAAARRRAVEVIAERQHGGEHDAEAVIVY